MDSLTALLHEDATQSMPPFALWLRGRDDIRAGGSGRASAARARAWCRPSRTASPAFGQYRPSGPNGGYEPWALQVLETTDGRIVGFNFFLDVERLFPLFGLPLKLDS